MKKLQSFFARVVQHVETRPWPFRYYFLLFAAILAVRLGLEFFSSHRLFTAEDIIHIALWFTFIVQAFLALLHLFSGEQIVRVAKLSITFFTIALTAPLIDIALSPWLHAKMNYMELDTGRDAFTTLRDVLWAYITVGGSSMARGATLGIRIEIVILILAAFNYIRTKRQSWIWGIAGAWAIYTVLFLSGALPLLLNRLVHALGLQYGQGEKPIVLLLLAANAALLLLAFWRHHPQRITALLRSIPVSGFVYGITAAVAGARLANNLYPDNANWTTSTLFYPPLLFAIALCLAVCVRSTERGKFPETRAGLLGMAIAIFISYKVFFLTSVILGLLFFLYHPPLLLNTVPVLRRLLESLVVLACALAGFCAWGAPMIGFPPVWILLLAAGGLCYGLLADMQNRTVYIMEWIPSWNPRLQLLAMLVIGGGLIGVTYATGILDVNPELMWTTFGITLAATLLGATGRIPVRLAKVIAVAGEGIMLIAFASDWGAIPAASSIVP